MAPKIHTNLYNTISVVALIARIIMKSHEPKLPGQSRNCHWVSPWLSLYCASFSASCMPVQTPCACGRAWNTGPHTDLCRTCDIHRVILYQVEILMVGRPLLAAPSRLAYRQHYGELGSFASVPQQVWYGMESVWTWDADSCPLQQIYGQAWSDQLPFVPRWLTAPWHIDACEYKIGTCGHDCVSHQFYVFIFFIIYLDHEIL